MTVHVDREVRFDGEGGLVDRFGVGRWRHLFVDADTTVEVNGVDDLIEQELFVPFARPRVTKTAGGLLVTLRGINRNDGDEPEDMVSLRMLLASDLLVTVCLRRVFAVEEVSRALEAGRGPKDALDALLEIAERMIGRIGPRIGQLEEKIDAIEEELEEELPTELQTKLAEPRRRIIALRKHLSPQRQALQDLLAVLRDTIDPDRALLLAGLTDRALRDLEVLESLADRARVAQDTVQARLTAQLDHNAYLLSVLAAVFLPLSLLTGVFGMNLGGMPGVESGNAFWIACGLMLALAILGFWILRKYRFLGSR